jgi:hypothetical protein
MAHKVQDESMIERGRGILSEKDRRYLLDPESFQERQDYGSQSAYERRKAIKNRVKNALIDFELLFHCLGAQKELDEFYKQLWWSDEMSEGAVYAIAFFYSAQRRWASDELMHGREIHGQKRTSTGEMSEEAIQTSLESYLARGISMAYSKEGMLLDEFGIHIDKQDTDGLDSIKEKAENAENVSTAKIGMLLDAGRITYDEFTELVEKQQIESGTQTDN